MNQKQQQAIALAGIVQAAKLVDQIARTGVCNESDFHTSIRSLFAFDAATTEAVYGGIDQLHSGFELIENLLGKGEIEGKQEILRYTMSLLHLTQRVSKNNSMLGVIHSRLQHASFNLENFDSNPKPLITSVAGLYQDTLSTLSFRVQVTGNVEHLKSPANADKIRALLLAGVRSTMLWRQVGGKRWQLLFQRRQIVNNCKQLAK
ncbi:High frequency lysogenization protein HflD [Sinobacterium norvegicum]|uniref:High frequency lysogenization protein HflD homolog n=1 Tax=Sinobacterium norvegicum TaxID=1641715 RepID=A0ABN8EDL2_9GAMM|nr:high frequency lysogenization protein HflD [Sinobacterium norvegicum]CAH0990331.1 High frequency lysogenization protein HflD [Sinobacterium norvegicum]